MRHSAFVPPADPLFASLGRARQLRAKGRTAEAHALLEQLASRSPGHPAVLHAQGNTAMEEGRPKEAIALFRNAFASDPGAPLLGYALATAYAAAGEDDNAVVSLNRALAIDPYMLPALLLKAQILERGALIEESVRIYRALRATTPDVSQLPAEICAALDHGAQVIAADDVRRHAALAMHVDGLLETAGERATAYIETISGRRKLYVQQPTGALFPFLPAIEYFDREFFPWFTSFEAETAVIRAEYLAIATESLFSPYVEFAAGTPVNQWAELNHNPRWSSFFLWKDGVRDEANCRRCPQTAALIERLPLLDVPGRAPTVMFSVLAPRTRIPAHTGVTNTRTTVHLPLIVPPCCHFRVGGETRVWREGVAWAFDDTIEHEASNESDQSRVILIVDAWNPLLTEDERAVVRAAAPLVMASG